MPDLSAIGTIATSLNAAVNITRAMKDLSDWSAAQTQVIELQRTILEAQSGIFAANEERHALIERIGHLEKEIAELKSWDAEKRRYELKAFGSGYAYEVKPDAKGTEPIHHICANCYTRGKKSFLQRVATNVARAHLGMGTVYRCPDCKTEIQV
jgi:hypothetical protein